MCSWSLLASAIFGDFLLQFSNNSIQENHGSFPLVVVESVGRNLDFTGNLFMNNAGLELEDDNGDDYYGSNDENSRGVIQLADFQHPSELFLSHNHFSNPGATYELTVNLRLPPTFILDLGLNFWDRSNYSAVIQR